MDTQRRTIGLALSGGGSRAIAFHLGCLRALDRLGLLNDVAVISTVSGGSVIGAAFHTHTGDFASFERRMRQLLAQGLARPAFRSLFGFLGLKIACSFVLTGVTSLVVTALRFALCLISLILPRRFSFNWVRSKQRLPLRRFASRTHLLEAALDSVLFHGARLPDVPELPSLVINATELRTGSAFRFSRAESGSWRWGKLQMNDVSVAHAVAASAAYPLMLPAFDEIMTFAKGGAKTTARVNLTDGGVYDNLGLGVLWPNRSPEISLNVTSVDTIICCSAGYGLRQDPPTQFLFARMSSAFNTVFDRAQNAAMNRLHDAKRSGEITNFILPYLGQADSTLPAPPANLVSREAAHAYPTNFDAMPEEWIDRLSVRGEQLTMCLAAAYLS